MRLYHLIDISDVLSVISIFMISLQGGEERPGQTRLDVVMVTAGAWWSLPAGIASHLPPVSLLSPFSHQQREDKTIEYVMSEELGARTVYY